MENNSKTDTAYKAWDIIWKTDEGRKDWSIPSPEVVNIIKMLEQKSSKIVLDLGCGVGRHSLFLAESGFTVHAIDGSISGIQYLKESCKSLTGSVEAICGDMTNLPYNDSYFDYILAWNVIYHGNLSVIHRVLSEVLRVLKPGGIFQFTMLSKRNIDYTQGNPIAFNTIVDESDTSDKNHPHFYCNSIELMQLLIGFEIISLNDNDLLRKGSYHWHIVAEKM